MHSLLPPPPIRYILNSLLDTLTPPRCMRCLSEGSYLCDACWKTTRYSFPLSCIVCGKKQTHGVTCPPCRNQTHLTGLVTFGGYEVPWLRRGIHWLKFRSVRGVAPTLANLLIPPLLTIAPLPKLTKQALLIPIPLHKRRQRQRGFNQSYEIAKSLSCSTGIPLSNSLMRTRATWAQAKLPKTLRTENTQGVFTCAAPPPHAVSTIVIIDDVTTTGSTLDSAAQALALPRDIQVWGLTVARG